MISADRYCSNLIEAFIPVSPFWYHRTGAPGREPEPRTARRETNCGLEPAHVVLASYGISAEFAWRCLTLWVFGLAVER
jgi:hypothetical protein